MAGVLPPSSHANCNKPQQTSEAILKFVHYSLSLSALKQARPEIWNHANFHFKENCPAKLSDHHGTAQDFGEFRCI
ncbi:hypothetical protein J7T55_008758 [Diaporthe amygdali]|uniref:uncharacterized protein n=1 Tax=Phomopsis amygdali TaxID=1214568 RepID=UPI0022FE0AC1|nr:uncharacterized protein J7T55_008758 [Diaporthe amygdali]KAJ0121593.1 hypothetical protein J7T55_008758 [Diaporthe amygdali]